MNRAQAFVEKKQNPDGSWNSSQGVCYTYSSWLGINALRTIPKLYRNHEPVRRACNFLLTH